MASPHRWKFNQHHGYSSVSRRKFARQSGYETMALPAISITKTCAAGRLEFVTDSIVISFPQHNVERLYFWTKPRPFRVNTLFHVCHCRVICSLAIPRYTAKAPT